MACSSPLGESRGYVHRGVELRGLGKALCKPAGPRCMVPGSPAGVRAVYVRRETRVCVSYVVRTRWDEWDEKIHGDSETRNWFMANTK